MSEHTSIGDAAGTSPSLQKVLGEHNLAEGLGVWKAVAGFVAANALDDNSRYSWRVSIHDEIAALARAAYQAGLQDAGGDPLPSDGGARGAGSPESTGAVVTGLYRFLLGREPDPEGLTVFCGHLRDGMSIEQVAAAIASSAEFRANLDRFLRTVYGVNGESHA
jgi:hypothetical protein